MAQLKKQLCDTTDLQYGNITFSYEGKPMIDPFSLNDFKTMQGKEHVTIKVDIKN